MISREPTRIEMQELSKKTRDLIAAGVLPEAAANQVLAEWEFREKEKLRLAEGGAKKCGLRVSIGEMIARKQRTA